MRAAPLGLALFLVPALAGAGEASPAEAVDLRLVSYNTHGLPTWIAGDSPRWRYPLIGRLFDRYALALVQEDFTHHELLRDSVSHPVILRGNVASGLTTLLRVPRAEVLETERVPYGTCSGWIGGAGDCWADKGFLRVRVRLGNGAVLDVVNTHLEAGSGDADRAVREQQVDLLARRLRAASGGGALVLAGDLNLDFDEERERRLLDTLRSALALEDSGASPTPGSDWKRIDYVLYRSGARARLELLETGMAREFVAEGLPLSDHPALFALLRVRPATRPEPPP